ncbi:MAG: hypothetical protein LW832_02865 [Parachlamydia sp.]|nr:hypothetical protein [Parachlamydia sp.]
MKTIRKLAYILSLFITLCSFASAKRGPSKKRLLPLSSIHIIDRNGFAETLSNKDRLIQYQNVDFLTPQPYQKVLRIYARDIKGNVRSVVTTYHENGNPKQYLQVLNGRALGTYYEWHENGCIRVAASIIGGSPDVTPAAEKSWLFDGISYAWDEDEHLIAEIPYSQGILEGNARYYHSSGNPWKLVPYVKNQVNGTVEILRDDGALLQQMTYCMGNREGTCYRYWDPQQLASQEEFVQDKLINGQYYDRQGKVIAEIKEGNGFKSVFGKEGIKELQQFRDGAIEGEVKVFNFDQGLKRIYHVKNKIKHGEEVEYYDSEQQPPSQLKLSFFWHEGKVQGHATTWYPNGVMESQKEMANNAKHGVSMAWYRDGQLMMIEEYDNGKLVRGDYFRKGERLPLSHVQGGKGTVSLFDADGHFVQKIQYDNGRPDV